MEALEIEVSSNLPSFAEYFKLKPTLPYYGKAVNKQITALE